MTNSLFYTGPSITVLHEEYAKKSRIDDRAAIQGRREIVIAAPIERVWQKLSDVPSWDTNLEPGVKDIQLENGVTVDGRFTRAKSGAKMKARFAVVDGPHEIAWTGAAFGAKVVHRFTLESTGENSTRVVVEESMAGPLFGLFFNSKKLGAVLVESLDTLKRASEG
ncbi:molecular chaperone Hsp90 [Kribbella qitaiheensis]|uniref:Molecular chaperone Hsp90 n=1 Tax=Kribbella qitaiheensis TaxID=1544730 RepID=A0A7G6WTX0_9ACTN|nr:SRPBCC family protein [Kribbella qitaiheensis]QNE17435.1 molecular chaperone Hsp90 [Kribbella qitaiheensis]